MHFRPTRFLIALHLFSCLCGGADADEPQPVARWDFGSEAGSLFDAHGGVIRDQAGPRAPQFPDFPSDNTAVGFTAAGGYLSINDTSEPNSPFDFDNGDTITLEAWVKVDPSSHGAPIYLIGKGRTGNPHFAKDNQNWALRLQKRNHAFHISFLFATQPGPGLAHWHRWTSTASFPAVDDWHHVAVSYRFGTPASIAGWIDGQPTKGSWDMGGATTANPVVDDDQVWIGTASKGNRFVGLIDNVAIHRNRLSDKVIAARFRRVGEAPKYIAPVQPMPELGPIPDGQVQMVLSEGFPASDRWDLPKPSNVSAALRYPNTAFLVDRLPTRYDAWGIRDAWREPVLLQMAADVALPPGKHRLLVRARGLGRLWIDGKVVAETKSITRRSPDGEQPVTPVATPPLPGARPHAYHQQEVFADLEIPADRSSSKPHRIVWELIVGGKNQRTEPGESCVAIQFAGSKNFEVLVPSDAQQLPLTNDAIEPALKRLETELTGLDDRLRREAASSQDAYWSRRHQAARDWAAENRAPAVPGHSGEHPLHPVDAFIGRKISNAVAAAAESDTAATKHFYGQVLPILREQCFRCHGEKSKGDLKLNSRDAALLAGESEQPAIVPGDPDASELIVQIRDGAMPPTETGLSAAQIEILENWIRDGAAWPAPPVTADQVAQPPLVDDEAFLRRVYLDTVGVPPTLDEVNRFLGDGEPDAERRSHLIDQLLDDPRLADHWVSLWQDLLAENPTLLNQSMGSTGPFRWFLYESLRDHKPLDRMITELIMMRGSADTGGSAGFRLSGESDAPFAEKANILAAGMLGVELQCARCHDSPYHSTTQRDLFSLAAMLERKSVKVPATSRVPEAFFDKRGRESLIRVTLKPDAVIAPQWPLQRMLEIADDDGLNALLHNPKDSRERLAALITLPQNRRFGRVMVNRVWKQLVGAGFVEPAHDWEGQTASHPELMDWLVDQLITHQYDLRVVIGQIMKSQTYQRQAVGNNLAAEPEQRFFAAPDRRRMTAEQIVDSLHVVTGSEMDSEELTFVHDGQRPIGKRQSLGCPKRAWMFASLNNERDRPSLSLPRARVIADVLQAFGWNGSRQRPIPFRDMEPNVLQPGVLANGTLATTLTRASLDSDVSARALAAESPETLVDEWFLRILCRQPTANEREAFAAALGNRFSERQLPDDQIKQPQPLTPLPQVTWFNHLQAETNTIQQELERRVSLGPPADPRLDPQWRGVYEDFIWSLVNHRDFVWIP